MPKSTDKSKRRRLGDQEEHPYSQERRRDNRCSDSEAQEEEIEVDSTQTVRSQASQKTQHQQELTNNEINRRVAEVVRYLLFVDRKKYPIKRGDITKNVLKEHSRAFNQIFDRAKKNLKEVFGIKVEEIEVGKTKGYILVGCAENADHHQLINWILMTLYKLRDFCITPLNSVLDPLSLNLNCWKSLALGGCDELVVFSWDTIGCFHRGDDLTKLGLLMVVLSLIFMSEDHVINESLLWHTLKKLGVESKIEHDVFGDPDKLISQEFVRQCYLERKKITGGDDTAYEYRWGPRAEKELNKRQVLRFVSELYDTEMNVWTSQLKEILAEEEGTLNGTQ